MVESAEQQLCVVSECMRWVPSASLPAILMTFHTNPFPGMQLGERLAAQVADHAARSELAERQVSMQPLLQIQSRAEEGLTVPVVRMCAN
jgi:hypothetical protein